MNKRLSLTFFFVATMICSTSNYLYGMEGSSFNESKKSKDSFLVIDLTKEDKELFLAIFREKIGSTQVLTFIDNLDAPTLSNKSLKALAQLCKKVTQIFFINCRNIGNKGVDVLFKKCEKLKIVCFSNCYNFKGLEKVTRE